MKLTVLVPAPDDSRYASTAFDKVVGEIIPFTKGEAVLLAATVADDGLSAKLTLDIPHDLPILTGLLDGWSFDTN